jgi:hypothetical protein
MPLTCAVYVASRRNVARMAGSPFTFSTTRHWPSPTFGVPARDFNVAGMSGTNAFLPLPVDALAGLTASPLGTASENDGLPPFGGGL